MSAYVVHPYHINALVSWAGLQAIQFRYRWRGAWLPVAGDEQRIAEVLWRENVRSVNHLYREDEPADGFFFRFVAPALHSPVQIIKACHCLAYQSCECDDWPETEARAILDAIEAHAVRRLPGYDAARWRLMP